ncbi:MAG: hypothetical protein Q9191_002749 [Dirinaria sp. TL-2023a]
MDDSHESNRPRPLKRVRSFNNQKPETIKFYTPLTLIVGYNGSGKTTIIESLKFATTGVLPPNSKGGAFIHDPKMCGEREVYAQVKLRFKGTNGATMVATRNLQLTSKSKGAASQKTLEGNILIENKGERITVSTKVAELDRMLPNYFGVSKAILESVIFCHQDESLWPMSEPASLKKKFDEIFEAQKYTKAIDNIKSLRKKHGDVLRDSVKDEAVCKANKVQADRLERKMTELQTEIEALRTELLDLDGRATEADAKHREYRKKYMGFESVIKDLDRSRREQVRLQNELDELSQDLKRRDESDDWLQNEINQYDERMAQHSEQRKKQSEVYNGLLTKLETARTNKESKQLEAGKYANQKSLHEQEIEERKIMIKDIARTHNIHGFEGDLDEARSEEFMARVSKLCKDQTASVERARLQTEEELQTIREAVSRLVERRSAINEGRQSAKQQLSHNDSSIGEWQSSIDSISVDEGRKALLESNIQDIKGRLEKARGSWDGGSFDSKLQQTNTQLASVEEEKEQLSRELARGTEKAEERARLDILNQEIDDNQKSLDTMCRVHGSRISTVIGADWIPPSLASKYQKVIEEKSEAVAKAKSQQHGVAQKLDQVQYRLSSAQNDLKKGEQEKDKCASKIRENFDDETEPRDYPKALETAQENRDTVKSDLDNIAYEKDYFRSCLKALNKRHYCRTCDRPFDKAEEERKFESKIYKVLAREEEEYRTIFQRYDKEFNQAREAGSSHATWLRLTDTDIPQTRENIKELEKERGDLLAEIEQHDCAVDDLGASLKDAQGLSKTVNGISKYVEDITRLRSQREEVAAKQDDTGTSRTAKELQGEIETRTDKARALNNQIANIRAQKDAAQSNISALERDLSQANVKLISADSDLERKARIETQIEQTRARNREHRDTIRKFDEQVKEIAPQIAEEEAKMDDIKERGLKKWREMQQHASRLSDSVHQLRRSTQKIEDYVSGGGPNLLAKCQRDIEATQREISGIEDEQKQISKEINTLGTELSNQATTKRTIVDNIKYRKRQRELEEVNSEVARLSDQNAEADLARYEKQADYWGRQYQLHKSAKTRQLGVMTEKDRSCQEKIQEWETEYQDAGRRYREAHIKVETTKAAVEDMLRYMNALDKAIMKYHSLKMEEINRIIEELWRATYQGTDVDKILIRSENEDEKKGNRSYNYRVCMVKQDAELDMRGRCSAGQKVLASIIIRLALAECFGVNCGLITLDEPTTNLDRDNIRSLAESLHDIIRARQQQANFQLVVITHDEEFLRFMKCADFCDHYFRISRDERQKSRIERQSIAEVL